MAIDSRVGTALPGSVAPTLQPGDANGDGMFDQRDIIHVLQSGKYMSEEPATWRDGDWNRDGRFDQMDIIEVLQKGKYNAVVDPEHVVDELFEKIGLDENV